MAGRAEKPRFFRLPLAIFSDGTASPSGRGEMVLEFIDAAVRASTAAALERG